MDVGPGDAALIWLNLILPNHWPILVAGIGTALYTRKLKSRGKFFFMAWILGYGMQGLVSIPWPIIWMMNFDKQDAPQELALYYVYILSVLSVALTLWMIHIVATQFWRRLYP